MRFIFAFHLLFFTSLTFAQGVTEQNPDAPVIVLNVDGNAFELYVEPGTGKTDSPHKTYIPVATTAAASSTDNKNYSFFSSRNNLLLFNNGVSSQTASLLLRLNRTLATGEDVFFVAFEKENGEYKVNHAETITSDSTLTFVFDMADLCADTEAPCNDFDDGDTNTREVSFNILVGVGNNTLAVNTIISDPSVYTTSVVYELNMSNIINTNQVVINDLFKGDGQLTIDYTASALVKARSFYAIVGSATAGICAGSETDSTKSNTLAGLGVTFSGLMDLKTTAVKGQVKLKDLNNDFCYPVRITFCDFYGFCTTASNQFQNAPENIQALLEKQACFFFTAGFGEEHPVVNYFQAFRDQHLRRFWLGRQFIDFYYDVAPQYTPFILERPWLQSLIRGVAYVLYSIMHAGLWSVAILFFVTLAIVQFRRTLNKSH